MTKPEAGEYPPVLHTPYREPHLDFLYNLLFCDDPALFREQKSAAMPLPALTAEPPDWNELRRIAEDAGQEGRVRMLACGRLRAGGREVPPKTLFGVIVEVPQEQGLDTLAAFAEGGVRYLNQAGKVLIFEGAGHPVEATAKALVAAAHPIVERIGPWDKERLPPPGPGRARLSFLVSDGLYFGEAPFDVLWNDALAGPVLRKAAELLQQSVDHALKD